MGMYDEIRCEYPLPRSGYRVLPGHTFQTKSFENLMDKYTITTDGKLILHKEVWEPVPEEERPYYGEPEWDRPFGRWIGSAKAMPAGDEEISYHGDVRFYDVFRVALLEGAGRRVWLEYRARFTEGRLSRIEVAEVRNLPPTKRVRLGDSEFEASESGLGFDVIKLGEEPEVEQDEET